MRRKILQEVVIFLLYYEWIYICLCIYIYMYISLSNFIKQCIKLHPLIVMQSSCRAEFVQQCINLYICASNPIMISCIVYLTCTQATPDNRDQAFILMAVISWYHHGFENIYFIIVLLFMVSWIIEALTHCGLVMLYCDIDLGQHWLR